MRHLKITFEMEMPLLFGRRLPTLDGILASELVEQQGGKEQVDVRELLSPYIQLEEHHDLENPVPLASQALVVEDHTRCHGRTVIGSFVKRLIDDYPEVKEKMDQSLFKRSIEGKGRGGKSWIKNTRSTYKGLWSKELIFFVVGDEALLRKALSEIYAVGSKRSIGYGTLAVDEVGNPLIDVQDISDPIWGYKPKSPALVDSHGAPLRPIPLILWKKLFGETLPLGGLLLEESYFAPYYRSQKVPCWAPDVIKLADTPEEDENA